MMALNSVPYSSASDIPAAPGQDWLEPFLAAGRGGMPAREAAPFAGMLPAELEPFLAGHYSAALAVALAGAECLQRLLADSLTPFVRGIPRRSLVAIKFVLERRFPKAFARLPAPRKTNEAPDPAVDPPVPARSQPVADDGTNPRR